MKLFIKALALLLLVSCSSEAPIATDETLDKGHDDWYKVVYRFTEGEKVDAPRGKANFVGYKNDNSLLFKTVQEYTFISTENGLEIPNKEPIKLIEGKSYSLEAFYYNKDNKVMNHEFTTAEMAPIHQHFFIPKNIESIKSGIEKGEKHNLISYEYRDTNPDNKYIESSGVAIRKEKNPIGLKGYFTVDKAYQSFDLKIVLVHVIRGSKLDDNGNPYPFYQPSLRVLGTTDLNVKVPMRIITSVNSDDYKKEVATEYNITEDQVATDLEKRKLEGIKI